MKLFTLYWRDGTKETVKADSLCSALCLLGHDYKRAARNLRDYTTKEL